MKAKIVALLKAEGVRKDYGCECHSVEKLAEEIMEAIK